MTHDIEILILWLKICLIIACIGTNMVPILYAFSPWRSRKIGKIFMVQAISFSLTLDEFLLFSFWTPKNILIIFWTHALCFTAIAASTSRLAIQMWKLNHPKKKGKQSHVQIQ